MNQEVLKTLESPDGKHRVNKFKRGDGLFGFSEEEEVKDYSGKLCWTPLVRAEPGIFGSQERAEQEAMKRVPWLNN